MVLVLCQPVHGQFYAQQNFGNKTTVGYEENWSKQWGGLIIE